MQNTTATRQAPTEKQVTFIRRLVQERPQQTLFSGVPEDLDRREASKLIDALLKEPKSFAIKSEPAAARAMDRWEASASVRHTPVVEPGMYRDPNTQQVYKVQKSKQTDNLYAKKLVEITGQRLVDTDESIAHFEFDYDSGAIFKLDAAWRMTLDEAKAFGIRYGVCCVCGITLKDATSVALGIGPVCGGRV